MRSEVEQSRGRVRVVIPGSGFRPQILLGFALPVFFAWFFVPELLEFFDRTHTPAYVQTFFTGFILLFFGLLPAIGTINGVIRSVRGRTVVDLRRRGSGSRSRAPGAGVPPYCLPEKSSGSTTARPNTP